MAEKIQRSIQGYIITKKGYKPTEGNLAASLPPKGGSGMESPPAPAENTNPGENQSTSNDNE